MCRAADESCAGFTSVRGNRLVSGVLCGARLAVILLRPMFNLVATSSEGGAGFRVGAR